MTQPSSQGPCICPEGAVSRDCPRHAFMQDYVGQNPFKDHLTGALLTLTGVTRTVRSLEGSLLGEILDGPLKPDSIAPTLGVTFVKPWPIVTDE